MKRWIVLFILMGTLMWVTGCGDGIASTRRERVQRYDRGLEMEQRMLADDIDHFMLADRPSRLSRWRFE